MTTPFQSEEPPPVTQISLQVSIHMQLKCKPLSTVQDTVTKTHDFIMPV